MADKPIIRHFQPGEQLRCSTGKSYTFVIKNPFLHFVFDGHSHIESGACCPLPLVWAQEDILTLFKPQRKLLNFLITLKKGKTGSSVMIPPPPKVFFRTNTSIRKPGVKYSCKTGTSNSASPI